MLPTCTLPATYTVQCWDNLPDSCGRGSRGAELPSDMASATACSTLSPATRVMRKVPGVAPAAQAAFTCARPAAKRRPHSRQQAPQIVCVAEAQRSMDRSYEAKLKYK